MLLSNIDLQEGKRQKLKEKNKVFDHRGASQLSDKVTNKASNSLTSSPNVGLCVGDSRQHFNIIWWLSEKDHSKTQNMFSMTSGNRCRLLVLFLRISLAKTGSKRLSVLRLPFRNAFFPCCIRSPLLSFYRTWCYIILEVSVKADCEEVELRREPAPCILCIL